MTVADGAQSRSDIAVALDRPPTSLAHVLSVVIGAGWVVAEDDPLKERRTTFHVAEPMVRFHRLVIEPNEARLTSRREPRAIWEDALPTVRSRIYGPHLEQLAKEWIIGHASSDTLGGTVTAVGSTVLTTGRRAERMQLDLVATERTSRGGTRVVAIGTVKAGSQPVGIDQLVRLDAAKEQFDLEGDRQLKKLIVARAGFTAELRGATRGRPDVELVDIQRLYAVT